MDNKYCDITIEVSDNPYLQRFLPTNKQYNNARIKLSNIPNKDFQIDFFLR